MRRPIRRTSLQTGDRLEKVGSPGSVWIVAHLVKPRHQPPHAVVVYEKNHDETRMLALSVLLDESRYRRLQNRQTPI